MQESKNKATAVKQYNNIHSKHCQHIKPVSGKKYELEFKTEKSPKYLSIYNIIYKYICIYVTIFIILSYI